MNHIDQVSSHQGTGPPNRANDDPFTMDVRNYRSTSEGPATPEGTWTTTVTIVSVTKYSIALKC